jgi:hypothetical protein
VQVLLKADDTGHSQWRLHSIVFNHYQGFVHVYKALSQ